MNRRNFLKGAALVPILVPFSIKLYEEDGQSWRYQSNRDGTQAYVSLHGRVEMRHPADLPRVRAAVEKQLDIELARMKTEFMKLYDRGHQNGSWKPYTLAIVNDDRVIGVGVG